MSRLEYKQTKQNPNPGTDGREGLTPGQRGLFLLLTVAFGLVFLTALSVLVIPWLQSKVHAGDDVYIASEGAPAAGEPASGEDAGKADNRGADSGAAEDGAESGDAVAESQDRGQDDKEAEEELAPREEFNRGVELLSAQDPEAAEKRFLTARDKAGKDKELRYRSAFNLGMTYAAMADAIGDPNEVEVAEVEEILEHLNQAAAWFRDAVRLRPNDLDARVNLETILTRIARVTDILNQRDNVLEKRLKKVVEDQRALREQVRGLANQVRDAGAQSEPAKFRENFNELASQERSLLTEANEVASMAGDELGLIEGTPEEERDEQQRIRMAQLQGLVHYLERARGAMAETRRSLRKQETDKGHRKADESLRFLKRAQDQLADPVTVLRQVAADQNVVRVQTDLIERFEGGEIRLEEGEQAKAPAWLTNIWLAERETDVAERTAELLARFQAASGATAEDAGREIAPEEQRALDAAAEAVPHLQEALAAMDRAKASLEAREWDAAQQAEQEALTALSRALERFAGYRQLIELAWREHRQMQGLLAGRSGAADSLDGTGSEEDAEPMSVEERSEKIRETLARNQERVTRLDGMFQRELDKLKQQKAAAGQAGGVQAPGGQPGMPQQGQPSPEELEAEMQKFQTAQMLRLQTESALTRLEGQLTALEEQSRGVTLGSDSAVMETPTKEVTLADVQASAEEAEARLEDLRLLFLTLVEHLKDLARRQNETLDETASVDANYPAADDGSDSAERLAAANPLSVEQNEHANFAEEIASALEKQSEAALQQGAQQAPGSQGVQGQMPGQMDPQEMSRRLSAAATEVSAGASEMRSAGGGLTQAPLALQESTNHQSKALEHLIKAIQILEPPPPKQQQNKKQQQSKAEAERKLQAVRDREAERRRKKERREKRKMPSEPVEKDW